MFLLEERDLCPLCREPVGVCRHFPEGGIRLRFWTRVDSTLEFPGNYFVSVSRYDQNRKVVASDLVIDLDHVDLDTVREAYRAVSQYVESPLLYHSGSKGFHIVVPAEALNLPEGDWTPVYETFARSLDIPYDPATFRYRALIRKPGTVNWKTGLPKRLLRLDQLEDYLNSKVQAEYTVGDARRLRDHLLAISAQTLSHLNHQTQTGQTAHPDSGDDRWLNLTKIVPPCIQTLYAEGLPAPGTRNAVYHALASYYRARGVSRENAEELLREYAVMHSANTKTPEAARVKSAITTVRTVYRNGHKFSCREVGELGICRTTCPLWKGSST